MMWLSPAKSSMGVHGKAGVQYDCPPRAIDEESNSIEMGGILLKDEQAIYEFRIFLYYPCDCRQEVAISESALNDVLSLEILTQSLAVGLSIYD